MGHSCHEHKKASRLSLFGGALSLVCAIHCLLMPVLLPFASALVHSFWLEALLLGAAVIVGGQALRHGYKIHGFRLPSFLFVIGIVGIAVGNWGFGDVHGIDPVSTTMLAVGGAVIVAAHVTNFVSERRWISASPSHE